jgi:hypothetical protein
LLFPFQGLTHGEKFSATPIEACVIKAYCKLPSGPVFGGVADLPNKIPLFGESLRRHADLIVRPNRASMVLILIGGIMPDALEENVTGLANLSEIVLREKWEEIFNSDPPKGLRRNLLVPILAYKIQEQKFGSLSKPCRTRLSRLGEVIENDANCSALVPALKPGTRLVRKWRDQVYLVNVETNGYEYQGNLFLSLSEIARLITGTRWSGPLFFGIKENRPSRQPNQPKGKNR